MLFLVSWNAAPECRDAAVDRFLETLDRKTEGVKLVGRWHAVGPVAGFALAEAADSQAIMLWVGHWTDLFAVTVYPAINDEQLRQAITRGKHNSPSEARRSIEIPAGFLAANADKLRPARSETAR
ncbi:hypothetical protein C3942_00025 [Solimonas fluminis]|uniref:DUF3303 domain-containing protein n=1 Tax=Solimonas fluminis TaxID=2086571 RepID=A0A2S5TKL8_9GAMM|nr:DUF3303 family protein [Solimonas fluminis]PPE75328.1 hypothetical protein C3942_00025 [Solimonas fluminis]